MQQTIFGMILGMLLVLSVFVGFEMYEKYQVVSSSGYAEPTVLTVDIDGINYRQ